MPAIPGVRFELRYPYVVPISSVSLDHVHTVRVNVESEPSEGSDFADIGVVLKGGAIDDLDSYAQTYLGIINALYPTTADFLAPQLWRGLVGSDDMELIAVGDFNALGTGGAAVSAHYAIATFRCFGGSILKLAYQECEYSANTTISFPTGVTDFEAIATHVTGATGGIISAQGAFPLVGNKLSGGQNEATWRRRNRP